MPVNLISRSSPWPVRPCGGGGGGALTRQGSIKHRRKASTTKNFSKRTFIAIVNGLAS